MKNIFSSKALFFYLFAIIGLFFYSFTQISLGLALTKYPSLFSIQRSFQQIGFFNRPLATALFIGILLLLFITYIFLLRNAKKTFKDTKDVWKIIFLICALLLLSYPAFSYDVFNYIFDAKILTYYGKNPYEHKALDFPADPMLSFMHWTHRTFPYGPTWLLLSIPLSYFGIQIFLLTLILFKAVVVAGYIGSIYYIQKIIKKISPGNELTALIFWGLNPLVIIESLVSAHHDTVMMFFALASLYFILEKKYWKSFLFFVLSIGIKYVTIFLFPIFLAIIVMQMIREKIPWLSFISSLIICMFLGVLAASQHSGNFQPWYLIFVLPFIALLAFKPFLSTPGIVLSFGALLTYVPYLYFGNWDKPVPDILKAIYSVTIVFSLISCLIFYRKT